MRPEYTIRPAQPADLDHLVALHQELQDHLETSNLELWRMTAASRGQLKRQLAARLQATNSCTLVAEHEGDRVVGIISGRIVTNSSYTPARTGIVDQAFVRVDHRREGVGSRLVAAVCDWFATQGVDDLSLRYVHGNTEAAGFWTALGFTPRTVTVGARRRTVESCLTQTRGA
jgi:GNAT superfamily N-acetyltransferase